VLFIFFSDVSISASSSSESKGNVSFLGNRRLFFDTHALVRLLEENGFTPQQSEVIVSALVKIMNTNLDMIYKDMVTKVQQEIALQQVMSHIGGVKKDMIILEKSEFSALRSENEKLKLELQQIKKQVMDEIAKVQADNKLNLNLEKTRVKELYSLNERKLLEMRTEIVELHAQQDRALTQTDRKIDTEVADLKTMLETHKLDNIKYLADPTTGATQYSAIGIVPLQGLEGIALPDPHMDNRYTLHSSNIAYPLVANISIPVQIRGLGFDIQYTVHQCEP
ncbi:Mcur1, partial [Columba guinea]